MGLQITPNTTNIFIHGTDIELTSVYARLTFTAHPDGVTISASFKTYLNHSKFLLNEDVYTSIHSLNFDCNPGNGRPITSNGFGLFHFKVQ